MREAAIIMREGITFTPHRGGMTFAVSGSFPYLGVASAIAEASRYGWRSVDEMLAYAGSSVKPKTESAVFYPTQEACVMANLDPRAGIGGLAHEAGHVIYDMAGEEVRWAEMLPRVKPLIERLEKLGKLNTLSGLHQWVNVCADIRLERMLGHDLPNTAPRLKAIQSWVHEMEKSMRDDKSENSLPSHIMCAVRDYGKGWGNPVWNEYSEEARNLVGAVKHIIEKLWT
ncbi:MAG: hypothetical protein EB168_08935, partial [Euryarchaeota archaeon]|nr:hypothetical protein [Euryarchaeota archaeon]